MPTRDLMTILSFGVVFFSLTVTISPQVLTCLDSVKGCRKVKGVAVREKWIQPLWVVSARNQLFPP